MKVFITGIAGFLGSHLAEEFIKEGHDVIGNDTLDGGYLDNVPKEAKFFKVDCCNLKEMQRITKGVDILYHCAAHPHEGLSVFSPSTVTNSVFQTTSTTLSAFIKNNGKRFIYMSSMARYGMNQTPFMEDMQPRPQDPYAIAKVASEELVNLMSKTFDFEYVIAIPHNIFGPKQKYDDPFRNVVAIFINRMLQNKQPIIYGDGYQKRCFSYIKDDIIPLKKLSKEKCVVNEAINIGPDEEFVTINELSGIIAEKLGMEHKPIYLPDRPQEVKEANCSADKARRLLSYTTNYSLNEGLDEMIEWIKERKPKKFDYYLELEIENKKTPKTWKNKMM